MTSIKEKPSCALLCLIIADSTRFGCRSNTISILGVAPSFPKE
jgi:hypothetical protein